MEFLTILALLALTFAFIINSVVQAYMFRQVCLWHDEERQAASAREILYCNWVEKTMNDTIKLLRNIPVDTSVIPPFKTENNE